MYWFVCNFITKIILCLEPFYSIMTYIWSLDPDIWMQSIYIGLLKLLHQIMILHVGSVYGQKDTEMKTDIGMTGAIRSFSFSFGVQKCLRGRSTRLIKTSCSMSLGRQTSSSEHWRWLWDYSKSSASINHHWMKIQHIIQCRVTVKKNCLSLSSWHPQLELIIHLHSHCVSLV